MEGVELGDERRSKRALGIADRLAEAPDASLPSAMGERGWTEALYRHLSGKRVTMNALLEPHIQKTVKRVAVEETVYAIADTTDFVFSGAARREGLGRVNTKDQGFLAHVTLAVTPGRKPLGLLGIETWRREEKEGERTLWSRRGDASRESLRWARGMKQASERLGPMAGTVIHVADREGDIYELLTQLVESKQRFIIRAAQDRVIEPMEKDEACKLFDAAQCTPTAFVMDVPLSARAAKREPTRHRTHPTRRERSAQLSFAARAVTLQRPRHRSAKLRPSLDVNIVHVFELGPPAGEPPVEWVLLTTEPVETSAQIEKVASGYRARWTVEEYFKAVKTGCAYESRQLESAHTLQALLAYTLIVAYALLLMRSVSRHGIDEPAETLLTPSQVLVLRAKVKKLSAAPTVRDALLAVAGMGGHLKNNGDPGWRTLSKGWAKLLALEEGYELARALAKM